MASVYPIVTHHFTVEWGGARVGFTEVSGLDSEVGVIEYREGNSNQYQVTKQPGIPKFGNITLTRGILKADVDFDVWLATIQLNQVERRTLKISLLDETHQPIMTWQANDCWPMKVTGPSLKSTGSGETAIEKIEICHEGLYKIQPSV